MFKAFPGEDDDIHSTNHQNGFRLFDPPVMTLVLLWEVLNCFAKYLLGLGKLRKISHQALSWAWQRLPVFIEGQ